MSAAERSMIRGLCYGGGSLKSKMSARGQVHELKDGGVVKGGSSSRVDQFTRLWGVHLTL